MQVVVLTAGDWKYKDIIELSIKRVKQFGYTPFVYDLGNLNIGVPYHRPTSIVLRNEEDPRSSSVRRTKVRAPLPQKPLLIADAMRSLDHWDWLLWLDGDAIITEPIDELFQRTSDVVLTVKKKRGFRIALNSGVVLFQNTRGARNFLNTWLTKHYNNPKERDQLLLQEAIADEKVRVIHSLKRNKVVPCGGGTVSFVPSRFYNFQIGTDKRVKKALRYGSKIWHMTSSHYDYHKELKRLCLREITNKYERRENEIS